MFYNLLCWKCIQTLDSQPHQTYFALPYHICVTVTAVLRNLFGGKIPFVTGKYHTLAAAGAGCGLAQQRRGGLIALGGRSASRALSRASAAGKPQRLALLGWPVPRLPKIYSRHTTHAIA